MRMCPWETKKEREVVTASSSPGPHQGPLSDPTAQVSSLWSVWMALLTLRPLHKGPNLLGKRQYTVLQAAVPDTSTFASPAICWKGVYHIYLWTINLLPAIKAIEVKGRHHLPLENVYLGKGISKRNLVIITEIESFTRSSISGFFHSIINFLMFQMFFFFNFMGLVSCAGVQSFQRQRSLWWTSEFLTDLWAELPAVSELYKTILKPFKSFSKSVSSPRGRNSWALPGPLHWPH